MQQSVPGLRSRARPLAALRSRHLAALRSLASPLAALGSQCGVLQPPVAGLLQPWWPGPSILQPSCSVLGLLQPSVAHARPPAALCSRATPLAAPGQSLFQPSGPVQGLLRRPATNAATCSRPWPASYNRGCLALASSRLYTYGNTYGKKLAIPAQLYIYGNRTACAWSPSPAPQPPGVGHGGQQKLCVLLAVSHLTWLSFVSFFIVFLSFCRFCPDCLSCFGRI